MRNKLEPKAVKCVFVGYGRHQKGYRCYDPQTQKVYTTMDCEFIEHDFYYHYPRCQGEKEDDDLRWLISPVLSNLDPKEHVRHLENESELEIVNNNNVDSLAENENEIAETNNHEWQDSERASYTLPPRTTQEVPPKRYDPDYEAQRSRYLVRTSDRENMSQSALAFNAALYSTNYQILLKKL
ncbi:uncharacterized protein LOC130808527 [Amaranthus tricolor]|uniref:uncharacterized protein LOC130808527 n=1 Tax=Amaranthus tricolor TaxID=29722 RepID=UPI002586CF07|nr:uncharacterized protein LOC130808527 [Amaranthus tricolor]